MVARIIVAVSLAALAAPPPRPQPAERVTCTAAKAVVCSELIGGCKDDRAYTVTFAVDRQAGTVTDDSGQVYRIQPTQSIPAMFEYAIQAIGQIGTGATETIVLGERSFVSSNVSVAPPRAYIQIGKCVGLKGR